jgi:hypothetical protein
MNNRMLGNGYNFGNAVNQGMNQGNYGNQGRMNGGLGSSFGGGIASILSGLFGNSGSPYNDAQDAYSKYFDQATGAQQPYAQAGQAALGPYQDMLKNMSDPSGFMNKLMGQYQQSPYAQFQQKQNVRTAQNMGSASGLSGSTPLTQFAQQNAQNISSGDMQNWLGNVLGVNNQAMGGYNNLINGGQGAANSLSQLYGNGADNMGQFAFGQGAGQNQDMNNIFGGIGKLFF